MTCLKWERVQCGPVFTARWLLARQVLRRFMTLVLWTAMRRVDWRRPGVLADMFDASKKEEMCSWDVFFSMRPWISWRLRLTRALRISNTEVPQQKSRQFRRCGCFRLHPGPMGGSPVWLSLAPQLNWLRHVMRRRQFLTPFQVHRDLRQLQGKRAAKRNGSRSWMEVECLIFSSTCQCVCISVLAGQIQGREGRQSWSVFFEGIILLFSQLLGKTFFLGQVWLSGCTVELDFEPFG